MESGYLYWDDHSPAHFHAEYGEAKVLVEIGSATVMKGVFPFMADNKKRVPSEARRCSAPHEAHGLLSLTRDSK
ncbi:MAG: DUF4160 domain-containing protein [Spirochaetota bacterium]